MNQSQSQAPFDGTFLVFLVVIGFVIGEGVATDLAGQLASLAFGAHHVVPGGISSGATAFLRLWSHLGDPRLAWGPRARAILPGPVAMWTALAVTELPVVATAIVAFHLVRRARTSLGGLGGGTAKVGRPEVERRMGRKAVERPTVAIYGSSAAAREPVALGGDAATGTRLFAKSEDYILVLGVPRVGRGGPFRPEPCPMDDDQLRAGLGQLANRIEGLEAQLAQLRRQVKRSSDGGRLEQDGADPTDGTRRWPSPEGQTAELESLARWVDELQRQYAAAGDWLVPCWWQHGLAVNELIGLRNGVARREPAR
jgi:hypothetical protein